MSKRSIVAAFMLLSLNACFSQLTINYLCLPSQNQGDYSYFDLGNPVNNWGGLRIHNTYPVIKTSFNKSDTLSTKATFSVFDTTLCFIDDGFGHESFAIPNDTICIFFTKMQKINGRFMLSPGHPSTWFHDFQYEGKNKYIYSLFDSLAYYTGSVHMVFVPFNSDSLTLLSFFDKVTGVYRARIDYLERYSTHHNIPPNIRRLAACEIKSAYILNLLKPFTGSRIFSYTDFPTKYIDTLKTTTFNDPAFFHKTNLYGRAAMDHTHWFQNRFIGKIHDENAVFKNTYISLNAKRIDKATKEYLLSSYISRWIYKNYSSLDTVLALFNQNFPTSPYTASLDSLHAIERSKLNVTADQALAATISDTTGNRMTLASFLKNKPVYVDCWASWCKPCIAQMPYSTQLEKAYGDKITFIYLSFDKDKLSWQKKMKELSIQNNSYLVENNFGSPFARYFNVNSIPRYLLFDKTGKPVNANAPRPGDTATLKKILDNLVTAQ